MVTEVKSATFVEDLIILIRDKLSENINDPLAGTRTAADRFVMTSYPRREVKYPVITVVDKGGNTSSRLGMRSDIYILNAILEIRIWARNVKERDEIYDEVFQWIRTNQLTGADSLANAKLHDFSLNSYVNINEPDTKSKVMEVSFLFLTE